MILDKLSRKFEYLRISITDKCNYRCTYCMPSEIFDHNHIFLKKSNLLTYEEIISVTRILKNLGLKKVRITGGEPMLRKNIEFLIHGIKNDIGIKEVAMTSNGTLFNKDNLLILKRNGLDSLTISLDGLSEKTNEIINPICKDLSPVLNSINYILDIFGFVKINMVVIRGVNESEILPMIERFSSMNVELRFIEYMDVGESNKWSKRNVYSSNEMRSVISHKYNLIKSHDEKNSTSEKWSIVGHRVKLAFISSISKPFCGDCNRGRLSADGKFYNCLFSDHGYDFVKYLRNIDTSVSLESYFKDLWGNRSDQYSKLRFISASPKRKKNKVEMSYIGG